MNTLTNLITRYMAERVAFGTYGPKSRKVVTPRLTEFSDFFGRRPLVKLNTDMVTAWLSSPDMLALSDNSRASYLSSLRQFTAWLVEAEVIDVDPCARVPKAKRAIPTPRAQTPDAVARVLEACHDDRERAIIWLMVGLGLRRMEVAGLRWEHYDDQADLLAVVQAKNGRQRDLPVTDEVAAALRAIRTAQTGPIIRSGADSTKAVQPARIGWLAARVMRRAGIKLGPYDGVSGHALRHTAASDVLDNCGDLRVVQQMLGHANLATTSIYLRRKSAQQMRDAMGGRSYGNKAA